MENGCLAPVLLKNVLRVSPINNMLSLILPLILWIKKGFGRLIFANAHFACFLEAYSAVQYTMHSI